MQVAGKFLDLSEVAHICVFGLGEAGSLISADLVAAGAQVTAFDPAEVPTPDGVERFVHPALAVHGADLVLGVTAAADAELALLQSLEAVASDAAYADLSTASPELKQELAGYAAGRDLPFADVALMSMVPGNGLATPSLVAGTAAFHYCAIINSLGGQAQTIDGPPGAASAKKLLRSVMMKGTAAVLIEAVRAGAAADDLEWLWVNLADELSSADEPWMRRLVAGSKNHARRRTGEMEAALAMLDGLGVPSIMTAATIESLTELVDGEVPELPDQDPTED